jgi:hypothetical protein
MTRTYACLFVLLVLLLCASQCAHAAEYSSIDVAAHDALIDAYNCGEQKQECGGVIYQDDRSRAYTYTVPITSGKPFGVTIPYLYSVPPPVGTRVVADYHNHICSPRNAMFAAYFSFADASVNQGFHIVGYMLDGCTGNIHRYDPAQDDRDDEEVDFKPHADGTIKPPFYLTVGHISGWIDIFQDHKYSTR